MAAAIAIIKTAPAARSFVFFIISLYSGETKSANDSMDEYDHDRYPFCLG